MFHRRAVSTCGVLCSAQYFRSRQPQNQKGCPSVPTHTSLSCEPTSWHAGYDWIDPKHRHQAGNGQLGNYTGKLLAPRLPGPAPRHGEPCYSTAEVQQRDGYGKDGQVWVTYKDGVYDVTEYIKEHPGGKFLLQAAGGPVDGWWKHWGQHHISPKVADALEQIRIGRLKDHEEEDDIERTGAGAWEDEQTASGRAISRQTSSILTEMPYQTETCMSELCQDFLTSSGRLYVRNHAPVPLVDSACEHPITFSMEADEGAETSLTLAELRDRFACKTITSILQCTGNRAADNIVANGFQKSGFVGGDSEYIGLGMLGNALWTGPRLDEVLKTMFPKLKHMSASEASKLHVSFEGIDGYYTSVPLDVIMDSKTDCLLAVTMNGEELTPDHGFPVRALLPGMAGARNVKWVSKISVGTESDSPWTRNFYCNKPANTPVIALPMNSVILSPEPGAWLDAQAEWLDVKGVAYPGGTLRRITKVEVSADRGQNWQIANCLFSELPNDDATGPTKSWVRFEANVRLPPPGTGAFGSGRIAGHPLTEIWCRAFDDVGGVQPETDDAHGGYMYNGYHRVPIVRTRGKPPLAKEGSPPQS